jgi:hypothetical protein
MIGFSELLQRVRRHCGKDDAGIMKLLTYSEVVGCLAIDQTEERTMRTRLARYILTAATEWLEEVSATDPKEIAGVQKLVDLSRECLAKLEDSDGAQ